MVDGRLLPDIGRRKACYGTEDITADDEQRRTTVTTRDEGQGDIGWNK